MGKMGQELERKLGENKYALLIALEEIAKGEGAFNRDPLTHAENAIENMKAIALRAITLIGS